MKIYKDYKIYGPYLRDDGRKYVVILNECGKKTTVAYPKNNDCDLNFLKLLEMKLKNKREIDENLQVFKKN